MQSQHGVESLQWKSGAIPLPCSQLCLGAMPAYTNVCQGYSVWCCLLMLLHSETTNRLRRRSSQPVPGGRRRMQRANHPPITTTRAPSSLSPAQHAHAELPFANDPCQHSGVVLPSRLPTHNCSAAHAAGSSSVLSMRSPCLHTSPSAAARCRVPSTTRASTSPPAPRPSTRGSPTTWRRYGFSANVSVQLHHDHPP